MAATMSARPRGIQVPGEYLMYTAYSYSRLGFNPREILVIFTLIDHV